MELTTVWFCLIAFMWMGYFVLEGFDFGIGMVLPVLGRNEADRQVLYGSIGPVWDANEVWLLVAGGATFAAFPEWYATLFSGFYLPLLAIVVALILRNLAIEYRGKRDDEPWRARWDLAAISGSFVATFLWGVAFANLVAGVPIDESFEYTGSVLTLLNPYGVLGGLTLVTVFITHGALFAALKTDGEVRVRAREFAIRTGPVTAGVTIAFLVWTQLRVGNTGSAVVFVAAAVLLAGGLLAAGRGREGWAFAGTFVAIALVIAGLFVTLFPEVMPSSTDPAYSLTVDNASASPYTMKLLTWAGLLFTPLVVGYQAWTYWVFRKRLTAGATVAH